MRSEPVSPGVGTPPRGYVSPRLHASDEVQRARYSPKTRKGGEGFREDRVWDNLSLSCQAWRIAPYPLEAEAQLGGGNKGCDPAYGARPLKRVIQKYVQDPLAEMVLAGKVRDGETVKITAGKDGLLFNGEVAKAKAA